jgi:hypothetical protein
MLSRKIIVLRNGLITGYDNPKNVTFCRNGLYARSRSDGFSVWRRGIICTSEVFEINELQWHRDDEFT